MRVPLDWLAEVADVAPGTTPEDVLATLVGVGFEEEAVHRAEVTGPLVVGRVLEALPEAQKNGKTIRWCRVDVGEAEPRGIVCGAPNVDAGDLVVVSLPGAVLPGGFAISARRTYGHVSDGMICSARELGIGEESGGILHLADLGLDGVPGDDAIALLGLAGDTVEVDVTPDRGYALSIRGVGREYARATGGAFRDPAAPAPPEPSPDAFRVDLADAAPVRGRPGCDRFATRVVRGVRASAPSPRWLQRRLEQAGMRPLGLAVDVTNYVMLATGQPLHAYDLPTLAAPITVRRARAGERLRTLDGVLRELHVEDLLVTDAGGGPPGSRVLGLAGVMGGAEGEVGEGTTDLLLEAAHFAAVGVARTSRRHKLSTEASRRFERGVDHTLGPVAIELAVRLLAAHGGPDVQAGPAGDVDARVPAPPVDLPGDLASRVVGREIPVTEVVEALVAVGCDVAEVAVEVDGGLAGEMADGRGPLLRVGVPAWRPDLTAPIDLVEEVARITGYDRIGSVLPVPPPGRGLTPQQRGRRHAARHLAEQGFVEVLSYPFVPPGVHDAFGLPPGDARRHAVRLANPLSDEQPEMRTSLLPPLLDALRRNVSRGLTDAALFEVGLVVRPRPGAPAAPVPGAEHRPSDDELAAIAAALPDQPLRAAVVLTGRRDPAGWQGPGRPADWSDAVEAVRSLAASLGVAVRVSADEHAPWHPGRCARVDLDPPPGAIVGAAGGAVDSDVAGRPVLVGHAGELHPRVLETLDLPPRTVAAEVDLGVLLAAAPGVRPVTPVSAFPLAKEDVALAVPDGVPAAEVEAALRAGAGDLLESARLFDVYTGEQAGEGRRSLAYALRLRAPDRTLTASELAAAREAAVEEARRRTGAVLRGSGPPPNGS